ncbi:MAG: hypothetical protein JWQ81_6183 [Amycolatopsis sp.]|jgi:RimJ/RimL family protein N-acetyltransferase|uniref:GNAT family N-acetyltransferase n=1 Tax=Amycolatopsis sp. TaxID=37632 RepID=UPI00262C55E1|nr:GNAT family N-acetyltransferase [Amycolatopsis sp.]MCU1685444.1 hypothetical protein [Amycolatopsis sp.]
MAPPVAREATESDAELLLEWRNDPQTRVVSRTTGLIPLDRHLGWLRDVLASPSRLLLVVEVDNEPVGTVRFDHNSDHKNGGDSWEVSITVAPKHRGRGLSGAMLAAGERILTQRQRPAYILAGVHRDNAASAALFQRAGYVDVPAAGEFRQLRKTLS